MIPTARGFLIFFKCQNAHKQKEVMKTAMPLEKDPDI